MYTDLQLFNQLVNELLESENEDPVARPEAPEDINDLLDLQLKDEGSIDENLTATLSKLVQSTPKTASKLFFNQLFGGRQTKAVLGDLLAVMLNNSMYTYKVAGPMVGIEKEIIKRLNILSGFGEGASGTIAPGGSMCNFMGAIMARDRFDPEARMNGNKPGMVIYTSAESHYSIVKNSSFLGVGRNNVREVACDGEGRMDPEALENMIQADLADGLSPIMINATAGSTVMGAFDPLRKLGEIAKKYGLWYHVDGAYSGGVIFSDKYKHLIDGLELADSFSLNAHKMLMTPLTCSILLTPHKDQLNTSFSNEADYLYQTDIDEYNLGKTSLQCGRRNDALKLWTLWKSIGTNGLEKLVENQFALADYAREYVRNNPDYQDFSIDESISICFNYKGYAPDSLCTSLYEEADAMVGYGASGDNKFIRLVTINGLNTTTEIDGFFSTLESHCAKHHDKIAKGERVLI